MAGVKNKYRPKLSMYDEGVPSGYVGIYDLFVISPEVRKLYGEDRAQKLRIGTYRNIKKVLEQYGGNDIPKFFNYYKDDINYLHLNEFAKFEQLKGLCSYIKCFGNNIRLHGENRQEVSFGIKIADLEKFKEHKEKCMREGIPFYAPVIRDFQKENEKDFITFGSTQIQLNGNGGGVFVPNNAVFNQFEDWRKKNKITRSEAIRQAMAELVKNNPVEGVGELADYHVQTVFDKVHEDVIEKGFSERILTVKIGGNYFEQMQKIIHRYNCDPANKIYGSKSQKEYIEEAIELMNSKVPTRYSDVKEWDTYINKKQ